MKTAEEDERGGSEDRQERPRDRKAPNGNCERRARSTIAPTISTVVPSTPLRFSACTPNTAPSEADEGVMQHDGIAPRRELDADLDRQQHERRHERDDEREENDVGRRRSTHREELGVLAEDVEERLRQREPRDGEQLRAAHRRLAESRCAF